MVYDDCLSFFAVTEAQIRFLKAKLRVMQEELDRLSSELSSRVCHFTWNSDSCTVIVLIHL